MEETKPAILDYLRLVQIICVALFVFGFLWNTTEVLNLTPPQFFMLYGACGALICEVICRLIIKKKPKK